MNYVIGPTYPEAAANWMYYVQELRSLPARHGRGLTIPAAHYERSPSKVTFRSDRIRAAILAGVRG